LHREMNFSATELSQLARAGFEVADLPEDKRTVHLNEIDRLLAVDLGEVS